jgi:hypothetical protein
MKYASAALESSAALPPVESMSLDEVQAELRLVTGKPWRSDADGLRRQALWKRLDKLAAEGRLKPNPAPTTVPAPAEGRRAQRAKPPDLQELVTRFGGYDKVTAEAWAEHDRLMAEYHIMRRIIPRK